MSVEKLRKAFCNALDVAPDKVTDDLAYNRTREWDSVAHMVLIAEIETVFDIMIDTQDVIDMSSFGKAKEILSKYGISF